MTIVFLNEQLSSENLMIAGNYFCRSKKTQERRSQSQGARTMVNYTSTADDAESTEKRELNEKRQSIAIELVETEESYVDYLRQLHDTFYRRLQVHIKKEKEVRGVEALSAYQCF